MKSREGLIRLKRFHVEEKRRQVAQIETMIAEFERMAKELDDQIVAEQERSGIRDAGHFAYPTFAKAAMQRRDNLLASAERPQGAARRRPGRIRRGGRRAREIRGARRSRPRPRPERRRARHIGLRALTSPLSSGRSPAHAAPRSSGRKPEQPRIVRDFDREFARREARAPDRSGSPPGDRRCRCAATRAAHPGSRPDRAPPPSESARPRSRSPRARRRTWRSRLRRARRSSSSAKPIASPCCSRAWISVAGSRKPAHAVCSSAMTARENHSQSLADPAIERAIPGEVRRRDTRRTEQIRPARSGRRAGGLVISRRSRHWRSCRAAGRCSRRGRAEWSSRFGIPLSAIEAGAPRRRGSGGMPASPAKATSRPSLSSMKSRTPARKAGIGGALRRLAGPMPARREEPAEPIGLAGEVRKRRNRQRLGLVAAIRDAPFFSHRNLPFRKKCLLPFRSHRESAAASQLKT